MLRHLALFAFTPDSTAEQRRTAIDALRSLPDLVPGIHEFEVATSLGLVDGGADLVVSALFDDPEAWRAYIDHPEHRRVADTLLAPIRTERFTIQYTQPVD